MNQASILLPLLALVGWTFLVLLLVPYRRFKAAFAGRVTADDFRLGESGRVPAEVSIPNRNYMNLLELPVLFYAVGLVSFVAQKVDASLVALGWTYVGLRIAHSVIHLTYNKVMHRLVAFVLSVVVLVLIWARLVVSFLG